jgi:hypothetical protein
VTANPLCQPCGSGGSRRVATGIGATALLAERASQYLVIVSRLLREQLRVWPHLPRRSGISEQHRRHRAVLDGVSVRRRFTASSFRFWGSATSGRLGRVTVLPQLKVDRLCSVVDGTADFDPLRKFRRPYGTLEAAAQASTLMETPEVGFDEPQLLVRRPQPARVAASPVCSSEQ